jgi:hypothetical protein
MRGRLALLLALCAAGATGCVAPATDTASYQQKALLSAQAAVSSARTALIAEQTYSEGRLLSTYLDPVLSEAEDSIGSVTSTFDSVQPPTTATADALRSTLDPLLQDAGSAIADLRIAARRNMTADMDSSAHDLRAAADKLDAFAKEHGG